MNNHKNLFVGLAITLGVLIAVGIPVIYFVTKKNPVVTPPQDTSAIFGIAPTSSSTASSTEISGEGTGDTEILGVGPTVTFTINNQLVSPGSSATLSWSAEGATLCSAGGAQDAWFFTGNATSGSAQTSPIVNDKTFTIVCADDTGATTVKNVVATIPRATTTGDTSSSRPSTGFVKDIFSTISWTSKKVTQPIIDFFGAKEGTYSELGEAEVGATAEDTTSAAALGVEKADIAKLVPKENSENVTLTPIKSPINSGRQGVIKISATKMASCKTGSELAWGENRLKGIPTSGEVKTGNLSNKTSGATSARLYPLSVVCTDSTGAKAVSSTSILVRPALQYTISFPTPDNDTLIPKWNESIDETAEGSYRLAYKHIARSQVPDVKIKALNATSCTLERPNKGGTVSEFSSTDGGTASGNTPDASTITYEVHCRGTDADADPSEPSFDNPRPYSITYYVHNLAGIPAMTGNPGESCKEMLDRAGYTIIAGTQMNEYIYGKKYKIRSDIDPISIWSYNCYYSDGVSHKMDYAHPDRAPYIPTTFNPGGGSRTPTLEKVTGTALNFWTGGLLGGGNTFGGLFGGSDQPRPIAWSGYFNPHKPTP